MYCIHCGEQVVASANFCGACGTKVIRQDEGGQRSESRVPVPSAPDRSETAADPATVGPPAFPTTPSVFGLGETSASSATGEAENFDIQVGALGAFFRTCIERVTGHRRLRP